MFNLIFPSAFGDTLPNGTDAGYIPDAVAALNAAKNTADPILIDLSGTSTLDLQGLDPTSPYVDLTGSGTAVMTAWFGTDVGVLVEKNPTTGSWTVLGANSDGWSALSALVQPGQPNITASDSIYADLGVWIDTAHDGKIADGNVESLADLGIATISLSATTLDTVDPVSDDTIEQQSSITYTDGSTEIIASVELIQNPIYSSIASSASISNTIAAMPELPGYGTLPELQIAMAGNSTLVTDVRNLDALPAGTSYSGYLQAVDNIMFAWAKSAGTPSPNPTITGNSGYNCCYRLGQSATVLWLNVTN